MEYEFKEIYRLCFLGSCNSGKTTIINKIVNNNFIEVYNPTYNVDCYSTEFELENLDLYMENRRSQSSSKKEKVELMIEDT